MDEEVSSKNDIIDKDDTLAPSEKHSWKCKDNVFLAPLETPVLKSNEERKSPAFKQSTYDNDSMHLLLPKVPCITPPSSATSVSSLSSLTAHLSRPPLNIPSLSFDSYQQKIELPNHTNISMPMPDISTLINKQNDVNQSIPTSYSILQQAMEPKLTNLSSLNGIMSDVSCSQSSSIKLPINLSTLVPVSKHSLNMEEGDNSMSPLPLVSTNSSSNVVQNNSQNPYISPFSLKTLSALNPLLPAISPQIQSVGRPGSVLPESLSSTSIPVAKESKPNSSTNRRVRNIPSSLSSGTSFAWPGVDAIVESYRKYNQGKKFIVKIL